MVIMLKSLFIKTPRSKLTAILKPLIFRVSSSGKNINQILLNITGDLKDLFQCEAVTVFSLDKLKGQVYSRNFMSKSVGEIRVAIDKTSLAGYVATTGQALNLTNVYDQKELSKHDPVLKADHTWDKKLNFKTKSVIAIPITDNNQLVGILEVLNKSDGKEFTENDVELAREMSSILGAAMVWESVEKIIHNTTLAIHSAKTTDEIILGDYLSPSQLFQAERITVYAVDTVKKEVYSKIKTGGTIKETRIPIFKNSIVSFVARAKKLVNIVDAYDSKEIKKHHPDLTFKDSFDKKSDSRTKSMLLHPLIYNKHLLGVVEIVNKRNEEGFTTVDEKTVTSIAEALAFAFFNQRKQPRSKRTKYGYLVENGIISQAELNDAIAQARTGKQEIETILLKKLKISRQKIGKSLELFFSIPYNGYSDSMVLPPHVFEGLNINYLIKHNWVPLENEPNKVIS